MLVWVTFEEVQLQHEIALIRLVRVKPRVSHSLCWHVTHKIRYKQEFITVNNLQKWNATMEQPWHGPSAPKVRCCYRLIQNGCDRNTAYTFCLTRCRIFDEWKRFSLVGLLFIDTFSIALDIPDQCECPIFHTRSVSIARRTLVNTSRIQCFYRRSQWGIIPHFFFSLLWELFS